MHHDHAVSGNPSAQSEGVHLLPGDPTEESDEQATLTPASETVKPDQHLPAAESAGHTEGAEHTASEHAAGEHAEHEGEHAHAHGHGKKHGKGHGDHGAHGHGGGWLVTYCDMITLLMALFICIVTFGAKDKNSPTPRKQDSAIAGPGGAGVHGAARTSADNDSLVWRQLPRLQSPATSASEMPPLYSDPTHDIAESVLRALEGPTKGETGNDFAMRVPLAMLFAGDGRLSPTGQQLLGVVARNLGPLPYEIVLQVDGAADLARGMRVCQHLINREGLPPSRLAVGLRTTPPARTDAVWFRYVKRN